MLEYNATKAVEEIWSLLAIINDSGPVTRRKWAIANERMIVVIEELFTKLGKGARLPDQWRPQPPAWMVKGHIHESYCGCPIGTIDYSGRTD